MTTTLLVAVAMVLPLTGAVLWRRKGRSRDAIETIRDVFREDVSAEPSIPSQGEEEATDSAASPAASSNAVQKMAGPAASQTPQSDGVSPASPRRPGPAPSPPESRVLIWTVSSVLGVIAYAMAIGSMSEPWPSICSLAAAVLPFIVERWVRARRVRGFVRQLPAALRSLSHSLRNGHAIGAALKIVANEVRGPTSAEFRRLVERQSLGEPLDDSVTELARRMPHEVVQYFAAVVRIQQPGREKLSELFEEVADAAEQRAVVFSEVLALTGEGRMGGTVLLALPGLCVFAISMLAPTYLQPLFVTPLGRQLLIGGVVFQVASALAIWRITRVDL